MSNTTVPTTGTGTGTRRPASASRSSSSSSTTTNKNTSTGIVRCDICNYRDGHHDLKMIHCTDCHVAVHRECYGMPTYKRSNFTCWACQAVGQSFSIEVAKQQQRHNNGGRQPKQRFKVQVLQRKRPTQCDLCSVDNGSIHAMHPLYDNHGPKARQVHRIDPNNENERRLVWVHSLCGYFLSTKNLMYGCDRGGEYGVGDSEEEEEELDDDDRSYNPELIDATKEDEKDHGDASSIHHFVYHLKAKNGQHTEYSRAVEEQKMSLKCTICGSNDKAPSVLRMPLQCCANDPDDEYKEFQGMHESLAPCFAGMHVGCARWGDMNRNRVKRVYYFPGSEEKEPVQCIFCTMHAEDVDPKLHQKQKLIVAQQVASKYKGNNNTARRPPAPLRERERERERGRKTPVERRGSNTSALLLHARAALPTAIENNSRSRSISSISNKKATENVPKKKRLTGGVENDAPVADLEEMTMAKKQRILADRKILLQRMQKDLELSVGYIVNAEQRRKAFKERKRHWKQDLSDLKADDFKSLWLEIKKHLATFIAEKNPENDGKKQASCMEVNDGKANRVDEEDFSVEFHDAPFDQASSAAREDDDESEARPPSQWSHLALGPNYRNMPFKFSRDWEYLEPV